jgi:hypothetical protein
MAAPRPRAQQAFSKLPVQIDAAANATITVPELIKLGNDILVKARRSGLTPGAAGDKAAFDALYQSLWGKYKDFAKELPIVFRWIVFYFEFDEVAFKAYMKQSHVGMWKDKKHMLRAQVDYLVFLRRRARPNESGKLLDRYRDYIWKHLEEEHDKFEEAAKEAEAVHKKNAETRTRLIREALCETARARAGLPADGPLPQETDDAPPLLDC